MVVFFCVYFGHLLKVRKGKNSNILENKVMYWNYWTCFRQGCFTFPTLSGTGDVFYSESFCKIIHSWIWSWKSVLFVLLGLSFDPAKKISIILRAMFYYLKELILVIDAYFLWWVVQEIYTRQESLNAGKAEAWHWCETGVVCVWRFHLHIKIISPRPVSLVTYLRCKPYCFSYAPLS